MSEFESYSPRKNPEIKNGVDKEIESPEPPLLVSSNITDGGSATNDTSPLSTPQRRLEKMGISSMQGNVDAAQEEISVVDTNDTTDVTQEVASAVGTGGTTDTT